MLERLFSRGASRRRVGAAVEQSAEVQQREALRRRSASILRRLESRQEEARRIERKRRRAAREAVEQDAREAEEMERRAAALAAEQAAAADAGPTVERSGEAVAEPLAQHVPSAGPDAPSEAIADQSFAEDEPLEDIFADVPFADGEEDDALSSPAQDDGFFQHSLPLRPDVPQRANASPAVDCHADALDDAETAHLDMTPQADVHPDEYEELRQKAEEARLRIARRLETIKEAERMRRRERELLDLGAAAPSVSMDEDAD